MKRYNSYELAEQALLHAARLMPDHVTNDTHELINTGFILVNPQDCRNKRSNYDYADEYFKWILSGMRELPEAIVDMVPMARQFVDATGLPENFSSSYGWKLKEQLPIILKEIGKHPKDTRRAYACILLKDDQFLVEEKTTHEYPCTVGIHFLPRGGRLHVVVNMRSNNLLRVMPYDVFNFCSLQLHVAKRLQLMPGLYHHQINSGHIFKRDFRNLPYGL